MRKYYVCVSGKCTQCILNTQDVLNYSHAFSVWGFQCLLLLTVREVHLLVPFRYCYFFG
jgi:hypothetical protein